MPEVKCSVPIAHFGDKVTFVKQVQSLFNQMLKKKKNGFEYKMIRIQAQF